MQGLLKGVTIHFKKRLGLPGRCGDVQCCTSHSARYSAYNSLCRSCSNKNNPSGTLCTDGHFSANPACCPCICRHGILSPYFSVGALGRSRRRRRRRPHDALRVRSLYLDRPAFQPMTVFEPGSGPAPHCCFKAMPRCGRRHPDHPSRGSPGRRRHGRRGWGGGARTGRPTPAGRCFPSFASSLLIPFKSRLGINAGGAVVEQPCRMREVLGSNPAVFFILPILIY